MHQMLLYLQECADRVMSKKIAEVVFECFLIQKGLTVRRQRVIKKSCFFFFLEIARLSGHTVNK